MRAAPDTRLAPGLPRRRATARAAAGLLLGLAGLTGAPLALGQDAAPPTPAAAVADPTPTPAPAPVAPPASPAAAADTAPAQRIEISAQPLSDTDQRRRDPVAKTVYGRDALDKYGDTSVGDVLKRLPGVSVQGGSPRLRGLGSGYTLLLVNGEPAPPGFSLDTLSPGQVERIELTRGPSAEHSAQAVAGTLNIILREPPRTRQREFSVRLGHQAVRPTLSANGSWGDRIGEGAGALSYTVPAALYRWRGLADSLSLRQGPGQDGAPQDLRVTGSDSYWGGGFNLGPRLSWNLGGGDSLAWQSFIQRHQFNNSGRFVTTVLDGVAPVSVDERFASGGVWQMLRSSLQWQRKLADGARLELKGGFQASASRSHNRTDGLDGDGRPSLARDTSGRNLERSLNTGGKFSQPLGEAHTLALGWELEQRSRDERRSVIENGAEQLPGYDGQPFTATVQRSALFAQDEWEIAPRWSTSLGLRAERIAVRSSVVGGPDSGAVDGTTARSTLRNTSQVLTPIWHLTHKLNAAGRDLLRASLTRSYKAPELNALLARPSINTLYPVGGANPEIGPDRIGNPALQPELATGLDLAFEQYLPQGGVLSIGGFHRSIRGLIRNQVTLQAVPWAAVPRWVAQPVNLARARSTGIELELKGRADELLPVAAAPPAWVKGLSLRAAASVYRSTVDGIPGPDNRLDQQQPWSASTGFDQLLGPVLGGPPLTLGASLAWTPGYRTRQTPAQTLALGRNRSLDAYALWAIDRQTSLRLAASNLLSEGSRSLSTLQPEDGPLQSAFNSRSNRRNLSASLSLKF